MNQEAGAEAVKEVLSRKEARGESLQAARRAVATDFIESVDYFVRSDDWKDLRPLRMQFKDLVAAICKSGGKPEEGPDAGESLGEIEQTLGVQVSGWVVSDSFARAKKSLWWSYYANVLAPYLRPQDRPEMLDWIRALAALERLRPQSDDADWAFDEAGCACVRRLNSARVSVPDGLFAEKPPPDQVAQKPRDLVRENIDTIRGSLEKLKAFRHELDLLYRRKINAIRLAAGRALPAAGEPTPAESGQTLSMGGGSASTERNNALTDEAPRPVDPPWLLTEDDTGKLDGLIEELNLLGVPVLGSLLPEVLEALNKAIAAKTAALTVLENPVDILGIGPTMSLIRRPLRGLQPPPSDSTGSAGPANPQKEPAKPQKPKTAPGEREEGAT